MPPLSTQPFLLYSPPLDTPEALDTTLSRICVDESTNACLKSKGNLPGVCLTAANDVLFGVYQDWVHQNPGIHLDGEINEDVKWQARWENLFVFPPNATMYHLAGLGKGFLDSRAYLYCIQGRKWNAKRVIILQTVILQRV